MATPGARFLFILSAAALVGAGLYGISTGGSALGVVSLGYKGGVGEHVGYVVLVSAAVMSGLLGGVLAALADADPAAVAEWSGVEEVPPATAPKDGSWWPLAGAFGLAFVAVGLVAGSVLFSIGLITLVVVTIEWGVKNWSERATGDPEVNRTVRNRLMYPVEIPVIAVLVIGFLVVGVSRVLLAAPQLGATIIAMVLAALIMIAASIIALRPEVSRKLVTALLLLGGVAVLVGGVTGAVVGERDIEVHGEEHGHESDGNADESDHDEDDPEASEPATEEG
jgi:hypothetical protein